MKYFIAITDDNNWEKISLINKFGVSIRHKKMFDKVEKDDSLIFYVKPKRISGIFKIVNKINKEQNDWGEYIHQMEIKPVKVMNNLINLDLKFIDSLDLFRNKMWGPTLNGKALIEISDDDYKKFLKLF